MAFKLIRLVAASLLAIPAIVNAVPSTTIPSTNPVSFTLDPVSYFVDGTRPAPPIPETNAQRFKRGLGPKAPVRRAHRAVFPRQSETPPPPPPPPVVYPTGYIQVVKTGTTGYLSAVPNPFGEYGFTQDVTAALKVELHNNVPGLFDIVALVCNLSSIFSTIDTDKNS